jgi:hypothetical protein
MHPTNHNGGPPLEGLSKKKQLELVTKLIWLPDLTAAQKVIAIAVVVLSAETGEVELGASDLKTIASVNKRDTVFEAKKVLEDRGIIQKSPTRGMANKYRIMPEAVMASIVESYNKHKEAKKPVPKMETSPVPGMGMGVEPKNGTPPIPEFGTSPVPQNGTSHDIIAPSRALVPACIETPSGLVITQGLELVSEEEEVSELRRVDKLPAVTPMTTLRVFETYNELAQRVGLPVARGLTPDRKKAIACRLKDHGGWTAWEAVLNNIERSAFLQGRNDKNWRPTGLDWFLKPANFTKVIEGAYGNGAHAEGHGETVQDMYARMAEEIVEERRQ